MDEAEKLALEEAVVDHLRRARGTTPALVISEEQMRREGMSREEFDHKIDLLAEKLRAEPRQPNDPWVIVEYMDGHAERVDREFKR